VNRRRHLTIGLGDYLIAATAATEGLQLARLNIHHFPMFADLRAPSTFPTASLSDPSAYDTSEQ
jgi:predicted nucleic acid-binding protein